MNFFLGLTGHLADGVLSPYDRQKTVFVASGWRLLWRSRAVRDRAGIHNRAGA